MSLEFRFVLALLTCFRLAELVAVDDGPGNLLTRFRARCAARDATLGELVHCAYCVGLWLAVLLVWPVLFPTALTDGLLLAGAIAGGQCFLENVGGRS